MLQEKLDAYQIILASQSPRRQMLLKGLDLEYEVVLREVEEIVPQDLPYDEVPLYLARLKSAAYEDLLKDDVLVITADTVVIHDKQILGKPSDEEDAINILQKLSGNRHEVVTGVCLKSKEKEVAFTASSHVWFRKLKDEEIKYYIETYKPYDKAGAYGIQEWIGYIGIEKIDGSFYNVMGLPVQALYHELLNFASHE